LTAAAHHVAGAALPVAIGLLALAAAARLALWAPADDPRLRALAREHVAPLSTWYLIATGVYTVALGATGDASVLAFAVPLAIGAAAVAARGPQSAKVADEPPLATAGADADAGAAPGRSLRAEPDEDARTGLWSR
jgi:hypothetical protein